MVIITLAGNLSGEVVVDAGVLHLLPGPAVLHHAGELLLHARHVASAVARAARRAAQEVLKQQVPLVYRLQMILDDCKLNIMRMIDIQYIHRPRRLRQVGSTGGCCCTGWGPRPGLGWSSCSGCSVPAPATATSPSSPRASSRPTCAWARRRPSRRRTCGRCTARTSSLVSLSETIQTLFCSAVRRLLSSWPHCLVMLLLDSYKSLEIKRTFAKFEVSQSLTESAIRRFQPREGRT